MESLTLTPVQILEALAEAAEYTDGFSCESDVDAAIDAVQDQCVIGTEIPWYKVRNYATECYYTVLNAR